VRWPDAEPTTFAAVAVAGSGPVTPGQVLIRRKALLAAGRWDPVLERAAEWDLWLRLTRQGPLAYLLEPVVRMGVRSTKTDDESLMFSTYVLFKWARDRQLTDEQRAVLAVGIREYGRSLSSDVMGDGAQHEIEECFDDLAALALNARASLDRQRAVLDGLGALARELAVRPIEELVPA
jgi:hypothetical protein